MAIKRYEHAALQTVEEYKAYLVRKGWTEIGHGATGAVFAHPGGKRVVKITSAPVDDPAMRWSYWCDKNSNPWSVNVLQVQPLNVKVELGMPSFAIHMEKLTPASPEQVTKALLAANAVGTVLVRKGTHWVFSPTCTGDMSLVADRELAMVLQAVFMLKTRFRAHTDMKPSNFLLRGTQVVFVDPIQ